MTLNLIYDQGFTFRRRPSQRRTAVFRNLGDQNHHFGQAFHQGKGGAPSLKGVIQDTFLLSSRRHNSGN
jgi:hypothetical protein